MSTHSDESTEARRGSDVLVLPHIHPESAFSTELQRVSHLFQCTSSISEAEFVINCKSVMNLLHYSRAEAVEPHNLALLVEVIEVRTFGFPGTTEVILAQNAIFTFVLRILPLVFRELIAPTSLLHPISPPMILSILECVDEHVNRYGDYMLQLRMAAVRILLQDNEDVALALSMCQMLPRIQPNTRWQPVMNPIKANPVSNLHGSISLPEIQVPVLSESPSMSQDGTSLFGSPIPSLSSLLNCTTSSSASLPRIYHQYDPNHVNIITESLSQPTLPVIVSPSLVHSLSAPNLRIVPPRSSANEPTSTILAPIITSEGGLFKSDSIAKEILFTSRFSSDRSVNDQQTIPQDDMNVLPDIHVELALAKDLVEASSDDLPFPSILSFTSQDDLTKLIPCPDDSNEPPSPSSFNPNPDTTIDADFSLSIGPLTEVDLSASRPSSEHIPLSPLSNQVSSPLSSPPRIIVGEDKDIFRNTFEIEVQRRPPSPYNKRLRSASNNPRPIMRRAEPSKRVVSASAHKAQLDPDLAALKLPPPPNPRAVVPSIDPRKTTRAKKPNAPSLTRRKNPIVINDDDESAPPRPRTTSASVNKENE